MLCTRGITDIFNTFDEIYLVFTSKKLISSVYHRAELMHLRFIRISSLMHEFYFIPSSESSAYLMQIKCILSAVKNISYFFTSD